MKPGCPFDPCPQGHADKRDTLAVALAALGLYHGANAPAEHDDDDYRSID
jgi:hypothetical protein